ncbi:MAG: 4Fe-4S binding protein [Nitrospirae bacterium]|nr:4Fe-4S binding protein [Nitrospirota bacterium]
MKTEKTDRPQIRKIRYVVQWAIFFSVIYAGYQFNAFVDSLEKNNLAVVYRPPSVEGFLPIGGLMSLKLWATTGILDPIHPAAPVILFAALAVSFLFRKAFCGWICPVGTFSETAWRTGQKIFGKTYIIPKYVDYILRSLKYLLMAFFIFIIVVQMAPFHIISFLETPYWKIADIKMLKFFTEMSMTSKITLSILLILSLFYKNFWCRYLCPYGALAGLLGSIGPVNIKRNKAYCIQCGLCSKNCPSLLPVDKKDAVKSPECTGCLTCVSYCPAKDALDVSLLSKKIFRPELFILIALVLFYGIIATAMLSGKWHSSVTAEELRTLIPLLKSLAHP